jgi:hypothetical protein
MALEDFFTWGSGGRKMTPDQLAAERQALAVMQAREGDTSPVAHWSQGLGRVVNALAGNYRESKADKAEAAGIAQGQAAMDPVLAALMGGGSGGGYTAGGGASGGTWTPAPPPPSATATPGMEGGLGFGASVPAMPAPSAGGLSFGAQPMTPQQMIIAGAEARGLDPIDVATAISYETGGKFDPLISGPTTQWGTHRGLIQFGEPQALQYGADFSSPEAAMKSQLDPETGAVWNYLDGVGVQPGMGLDNIYSAINAGAPGRFNASDANNGGAPGTVADKVAGMGGHRQKAAEFLGGTWTPNPDAGGGNPVTMSTSGQPAARQGDILSLLMAAQADPWARKQYGPVIDALMGSELSTRAQAQDPMYQLGLQKAQLEVDAMGNPNRAYAQRAAVAAQYGMHPGTPQFQNFVLGGDLGGGVGAPASFTALDMQANAAGLQDGTPEYQQFMLRGGQAGNAGRPAAFEALHQQALAAGFDEGTPEYRQFMATRGSGLVAEAKAIGEQKGAAIAGAPADIAQADETLGYINEVRNHPGLGMGTGLTSLGNRVPGTSGYDFQNRVDQLLSGGFLTAIDQLRGMGSLSNAEGQTATQAISRMDTATSEAEFLAALSDYEGVVKKGRDRAASRIKAPEETPAPLSQPRRRWNPEKGAFE